MALHSLYSFFSILLPVRSPTNPYHMCFAPDTLVPLLFLKNTRYHLAQDLHTCCTLERNVLSTNLCMAQDLTTLAFQAIFSMRSFQTIQLKMVFSEFSVPHNSIIFHHQPGHTLHIYVAHCLSSIFPFGMQAPDDKTACQFS